MDMIKQELDRIKDRISDPSFLAYMLIVGQKEEETGRRLCF